MKAQEFKTAVNAVIVNAWYRRYNSGGFSITRSLNHYEDLVATWKEKYWEGVLAVLIALFIGFFLWYLPTESAIDYNCRAYLYFFWKFLVGVVPAMFFWGLWKIYSAYGSVPPEHIRIMVAEAKRVRKIVENTPLWNEYFSRACTDEERKSCLDNFKMREDLSELPSVLIGQAMAYLHAVGRQISLLESNFEKFKAQRMKNRVFIPAYNAAKKLGALATVEGGKVPDYSYFIPLPTC